MTTILGTEGDDDGIGAPALASTGPATTIYGFGGDDLLVSSSRLFDTSPDVLHGGDGDDTYDVPLPVIYPIYSTPIIWALFEGNVEIHEAISATDRGDRLLLNQAFRLDNTTIAFDGQDLLLTNAFAGAAQQVRIVGAYGVDSTGTLLAGVDLVTVWELSSGAAVTLSLTEAHPLLGFLRTGGSAADTLAATATASVLDGREGDDSLAGGVGDDLLAGGLGQDRIAAGAGDDRAHGGDGDDSLDGGNGADSLHGMAGADSLAGGAGDDAYHFDGARDGVDTIVDAGGTADRIVFGAGIAAADLVLTRLGADLRIDLAGAPGTGLLVLGQSGGGGRIESLAFTDGTLVDLSLPDNAAPLAATDRLLAVAGRTTVGNLLADNGAGADTDPDGDALSVVAGRFRTEAGGLLTVGADGSFSYRQAKGYAGPDGATYRLRDALGAETTGRIEIEVVPNLAPVVRADRFVIQEDAVLSGNLLADNGFGADSDPNGDALSARPGTFATAGGGTVTITADGRFTYVPPADASGTDSFAYRVLDGFGGNSGGRVTIQVLAVNDAPDARNDSFAGTVGATIAGNLLANNGQGADRDAEGGPLAVTPAEFLTARGGLVTIGADGAFTYRALDGQTGTDTLTYTLRDPAGATDTATVSVTIAAPAGALLGTAGDNTLTGTAAGETILGLGGADRIAAGDGADDVYGGAGNDRVEGGRLSDTLRGGQGLDRLEGDGGADLLIGGAGADTLDGGDGADSFRFERSDEGRDSIVDFDRRDGDRIDLAALLAGTADPAAAARITVVGADSLVSVDLGGPAPVDVALLLGVASLPGVATLVAEGTLVLA